MPRGRHRHSPPLHRLLPPAAVVGASAACAAGAWLSGDPMVLRLLVAAAAVAAATGAVLMRSWSRTVGKQIGEIKAARARDEWRAEERIAELETDLEEARALRTELDARLLAKHAELARLRGEHAALLRRYATAETERASALEGRRLLALEAAAPARALTAAPAAGSLLDSKGAPTPAAYVKANQALTELIRNGARQHGQRTVEAARRRDIAEREREEEPTGKHAAVGEQHPTPRTAASEGTLPHDREPHPVPAATPVVPYAPLRRRTSRAEGGFDFFGTGTGTGGKSAGRRLQERPELAAAPEPDEDMADVAGAEALSAVRSEVGQVIDLTEHDETEPLDVRELRAQTS